jgi:catechol 2,3-dioxygenase-like lactoylglutathione lyase family enzyme
MVKELGMLANAPVYVSLPTTDLPRARRFYEQTLGLLAVLDRGGR